MRDSARERERERRDSLTYFQKTASYSGSLRPALAPCIRIKVVV